MKKLQERKAEIYADEYIQELEKIHQNLINLGEWWVGVAPPYTANLRAGIDAERQKIEDEVFRK